MKCNCGYTAFYYQKFSDNKRWNVYKCGHVIIESKKKTKCDMNICEYVSDIKEVNFTETEEKIVYTTETPNPEKVYRNVAGITSQILIFYLEDLTLNYTLKKQKHLKV